MVGWITGISRYYDSFNDEVRVFFLAFTRFEHALNLEGTKFLRSTTKDIDWQLVGDAFTDHFFRHVWADGRVDYLIKKRPAKIKYTERGLEVETVSKTVNDVRELFEAFSQVRNNLYRSGKPDLSDRDLKLIRACNAMLELLYDWAQEHEDLERIAANMF
jgi:hypothetical protein